MSLMIKKGQGAEEQYQIKYERKKERKKDIDRS